MERKELERLETMDWRIHCTDRAEKVLEMEDVHDALWRHLALVSEILERSPKKRQRLIRTNGRDRNQHAFQMISGFRQQTTLVVLPEEL